MAEFKTVADFIKVPDTTETIKNQLQIQSLMQQIQTAPIDLKIKQIRAAIDGNDLLMTDIKNEKAFVDLTTAKNQEARSQIEFLNEQVLNVRQGFQQSFELGDLMAKRFDPNVITKQNEDGSVSLAFPGQAPIKLYTKRLTDPKDLESARKDRSDRWAKITGKYQTIFTQHQTATELLGLGTGEADRSAIYAIAKMQDPLGSVREGDYESVINSPNISQNVKNMLIRATQTEGPVFGPIGSPTRTSWQNTIDVMKKNEFLVTEPQARGFINSAVIPDGIDPRAVALPVGDLTVDFLTAPPGQPPPASPPPAPTGRSTKTPAPVKEAGFFPSKKTEQVATPKLPPLKLTTPEERAAAFESMMGNMFELPER